MKRTKLLPLFIAFALAVFSFMPCAHAQTSLPYTEGFESGSWPLNGWTSVGSGTKSLASSHAHGGSKSLKFSASTSNIAIMPEFEAEISGLELSVWWIREGNYIRCGEFDFGYITDVNDASTFVAVKTVKYNDHSAYYEEVLTFPNAPVGARIAFRHRPEQGGYYWFIDDITVSVLPACQALKTLTTSATCTSLTANWTLKGDTVAANCTGYEVKLTSTNYPDTTAIQSATINDPTVTSYAFNNLDRETTYYVHVRSNCGNDDGYSTWVSATTQMPTCCPPTNIAVTNITNNQATLLWTPGGNETDWILQYKASGEDDWNTINVSANPSRTLNGLEANETYTFKMRSDCLDEQSEWTNEATFKTLCNPFTPEGLGTVSFETLEGFTTGQGNMANCWTVGNMQSTSTSYIPYVETSYGHTGSNCMLINGYNSSSTNADSAYAVMPPMVFDEDITSYQVKFWMKKCNASSNYNDTLYVGIVSDPNDMSSLQILGYAVNTTTIYNNYNVVFSNYTGGASGYIVFLSAVAQNSTATDKYAQFYVDDVTVEIQPTPVSYLSPVYNTPGTPTSGIASWNTLQCTNYTPVTSSTTTWGTAGTDSWYVLNSNVTINSNVTCYGNVHLILMNGYTLNTKTIVETGGTGNSFTVYAQDTAYAVMGSLNAYGYYETSSTPSYHYSAAGIGGGWRNVSDYGDSSADGSNITINGGKVSATGGTNGGAGIGGGFYDFSTQSNSSGSNITINGGYVTAIGKNAAGIGGGYALNSGSYTGSNITINGGNVTATGGGAAAGIGGGCVSELASQSESENAGSNIIINNGKVIATGGTNGGAGIGGGVDAAGSHITIAGGEVSATGYAGAAGIGGGKNGEGTYITISGGNVNAMGSDASGYNGGAGIGGGYYKEASNISISGGSVTAMGGAKAAGIGGGKVGTGSDIVISGGSVTATGGSNAAGIGDGGDLVDDGIVSGGSDITITGGSVTATGGSDASGIGAGNTLSYLNIFVADSILLKADNNNPPTTVIAHASITTDVATSLADERYATAVVQTPVPAPAICSIGTTTYTTIADAIAAAHAGDTILMIADATENVTIVSSDTLILDLNGKILKPHSNGSPTFTISGKLTLTDNSVNVKHYFSKAANGLWVPSEKAAATDSVTGGAITGATSKSAVLVNGGSFVMEQGNIAGNSISETGAGVYMAESMNGNFFEMKGGCIVGNVAQYGGGVAACNGTFTMTGGEIRNNNAQNGVGGGVIVKNTGNFVMTGGKVTGNTATDNGGGVYFEAGAITLGGMAQITGNTVGTAECNLTLITNKTFAVSNTAFANGANVGVTTSDPPTLGNPVAISSNGAATDVPYFTSDNSNYVVNFNTNHLELAVPVCEIHNGTAVVSHYATVQAAVNAASTGDTIRMIANSTENVTIASNDTLTLDLNGNVLKGAGSSSVVTVNGNASFTLTDGDSTAVHYYTVGGNGVWSWIASPTAAQTSGATAYDSLTARPASDAVIAVKGGAITGGVSGWCGGGVIVAGNNGCFTMNGGNVIGNVSSVFGGGVSVSTGVTGTAQINGGRIIGNNGKCGGGVHGHTNTSTLIVTGGDISFNYGWDSGGGIKPYAMFSMTGGQVRYNYSPRGGGLDCEAGNISILGGSIIQNMANSAGGVCILNCALTLGGDAQITANTLADGTTACNLWLQNGKTATISDATSLNGANIGISTQYAPTVSTPIVVSSNGVLSDEQYFTADAQGKEVKFVNNRLALRYRDFQFTLGNSIDTIYTATAHSVSVNVTTPATGATVKYSTDKGSTWTDGSSVSRTNAGTDTVKFKISAAGWADTITDAVVLNVTKRAITMSSASNSKTFDGTALTDDNVTVTGDLFIEGEGATYNVTGSQTNAGSSANTFTYTLNSFTLADNYDIDTTYGTLTVNAVGLSSCSIEPVLNQTHTGDSIKPDINIHYDLMNLVKGTDYTVAYENDVNIGVATAKVTGMGNFTGTITLNFTIVPDTFTVTLNVNNPIMGSVTGAGRYAEYTNATLTATATEQFHFVQWNDGNPDNPRTVYVESDTTFTAIFSPNCGQDFTVTDVDNNVYNTVKIGGQCWLRENLRTTRYADGNAVAGDTIYYSDINPDTNANVARYGRLYSWYAANRMSPESIEVNGKVQGVCPNGWHIPSQAEFTALLAYEAPQMKDADTWIDNSGVNSTNFTAVAGGYYTGTRFENLGCVSYVWSSEPIEGGIKFKVCTLALGCVEGWLKPVTSDYKVSVRCVMD